MKWFLSHSLGILVTAVALAGGCSDQADKTTHIGSGQKPTGGSAVGQAAKPADAKTAATSSAPTIDTGSGKNLQITASSTITELPTPLKTPTPSKTTVDEKKMSVTQEPYGKLPAGTPIEQYTLRNSHGLKVKIITYGAIITAVETPDRNGHVENVTLYRDSLADYMEMKDGKPTTPFFGATVGRYANRIAKGKFTLDGKDYTLAINNPPNALHGGLKGFDKVVWKAEPLEAPGTVGVVFTHTSPDMDQGYPGEVKAKVTYSLTDNDELKMDYEATTDKDTVINLTNHTYWNLAGAGKGDVLGHELTLNADRFLPVDSTLIPLGQLAPVKGTAMDFTAPKTIGKDLAKVEGGYDHCYIITRKDDGLSLAARVSEPTSGRVMEVYTTQPGVQFYTGNFLDGTVLGGGKAYEKHYGFCLETQHYPDSPNQKQFPTTVLKPGETYKQSTVHKFSVQK